MNKKPQLVAIIFAAAVFVGLASFFTGKAFFYKDGYHDGVIFADSSSYKRGKTEGYKEGYEIGYAYCDSISKDFDRLRTSEMFNLNIILEELADPKANIRVMGTIERDEEQKGAKYVKGRLTNSASFARYNEVTLKVRFKDKQEGVLEERSIKLPLILFPRKSTSFEIPSKDVPESSETVEIFLENAQGMD